MTWLRRILWTALALGMLALLHARYAGATVYTVDHGYPNAPACRPNLSQYGYFQQSKWRSWPQAPRPEQENPQAVGAEAIERPESERVPRPKPPLVEPPAEGTGALPGLGGREPIETPPAADSELPGAPSAGSLNLPSLLTPKREPGRADRPGADRSGEPKPGVPADADTPFEPPEGKLPPARGGVLPLPGTLPDAVLPRKSPPAEPKSLPKRELDFPNIPEPSKLEPNNPVPPPFDAPRPSGDGAKKDAASGTGSKEEILPSRAQFPNDLPAVSAVFAAPVSEPEAIEPKAAAQPLAAARPDGVAAARPAENDCNGNPLRCGGAGLAWPSQILAADRPSPFAARQASHSEAPAASREAVRDEAPADPAAASRSAPLGRQLRIAGDEPATATFRGADEPGSLPQEQPQEPQIASPIALRTPASDAAPELRGYCLVELLTGERWKPGDVRWSAVYDGRTYHFAGPEQRDRFLASPQRFLPAAGGEDPVLAHNGQHVPGRIEFCAICEGRLFMFSSAETVARFRANPKAYASAAR